MRLTSLLLLVTVAVAPVVAQQTTPEICGRFVEKDGFRTLYLWGTPEQRGFAQGYLLADTILRSFEADLQKLMRGSRMKQYEKRLLKSIVPRFAFSADEEAELAGMLKGIKAKLPADKCKLAGVDRPVSLLDLKALNTVGDWMALGCSTFAISGAYTTDGKPAAARNFDFAGFRMVLDDQLGAAAGCGAESITFVSGIDVDVEHRPAALAAFADVCRWFCGRAKEHGMIALIEPFDRDFHRKFLIGPTTECVELIELLRPGIDNLYVQLDMAHVRLSGETFGHAVTTAKPYLGHVHVGNCVMYNRNDPFFGDRHPPFGYPGGEIDVPELTTILRALLDVGYLSKQSRGTLVIETQPAPGGDVEALIQQGLAKLDVAWRRVLQ